MSFVTSCLHSMGSWSDAINHVPQGCRFCRCHRIPCTMLTKSTARHTPMNRQWRPNYTLKRFERIEISDRREGLESACIGYFRTSRLDLWPVGWWSVGWWPVWLMAVWRPKNCAISHPPKGVWVRYSHWANNAPNILNQFLLSDTCKMI